MKSKGPVPHRAKGDHSKKNSIYTFAYYRLTLGLQNGPGANREIPKVYLEQFIKSRLRNGN